MRFLIYSGMVYAKYIEQTGSFHQYSTKQQKAPTPRCVCFYNGIQESEDKVILSLSSAFDAEADIELKVTMLNINYSRNRALVEACKPLKEYAWFVEKVNDKQKKLSNLEAAVDQAIDEMPDNFVIKAFLTANRAEVKRMCITEYNEAKEMTYLREEAIEDGFREGHEKGLREGHEEGLREGHREGLTEGLREGEKKLSSLLLMLKDLGRTEDVFRAVTDLDFRNEMYRKLNIE